MQGNINHDGLDNFRVQEVNSSIAFLQATGKDFSIVSDEKDIELLLAILSNAGVNLFDGYTQFQNIMRLSDSSYIFQVRRQKILRTAKGEVIVANEYDFSSLVYKKLSGSYGKIGIEAGRQHETLVTKLLGYIFSSDEVFIKDHEAFSNKYRVRATDKSASAVILSDALLDTLSKYDDIILSVVEDNLTILRQGIDKNTTEALLTISDVIIA
jgi:hypothetical protein